MNITPVAPAADTPTLKKLKKACEQFEAVFAKQLLTEMRKGTDESSSSGDQAGSAIYKDMMDQAIGDSIAHQGALGIGQMLYKQFAGQVAAYAPATKAVAVAPLLVGAALGSAMPLQGKDK